MATFYKTTIAFEVLHEEPLQDDMSINDVVQETDTGGLSGMIRSWDTEEVDGPTMATLLLEQSSDPEFFRLDDKGNKYCDDCDRYPCVCEVSSDEQDRVSLLQTAHGDECPLCRNGTVEHLRRRDVEWVACRGECGSQTEKPDPAVCEDCGPAFCVCPAPDTGGDS
jgi:hypothetical protein